MEAVSGLLLLQSDLVASSLTAQLASSRAAREEPFGGPAHPPPASRSFGTVTGMPLRLFVRNILESSAARGADWAVLL
jgi:hypothetical protein